MCNKFIMSFKGVDGEAFIYNDKIEIKRRSFLGNMDAIIYRSDKGIGAEKIFNIEDLESVEFVKASMWKNGYINFGIHGEIKITNGLKGAAKCASALVLYPSHNIEAEKAYIYLTNLLKEKTVKVDFVENKQSNLSLADEIKKLNELYQQGIITLDEFKKAKEKLL